MKRHWSFVLGHWSRQRGFALLIVLTLLAFLVLLLVGLASVTRVETAVAGNTQRQAQARENALLALNLAVGQLQRYAGPDQRVTATAQGLPNQIGTEHWTGVWRANTVGSAAMTWLVSGNELSRSDPDPAAPPGAVQLQPLAVSPNSNLPPTADFIAQSTTGKSNRTSDYVSAPLVPITAQGVPGNAVNTSTTVGRYAWWVGDQGVKASVALTDRAVNIASNAAPATTVSYEPYDSIELRRRIRQQLGLGGGASASDGTVVFEPRVSTPANPTPNAVLANNVTGYSQFAFFRNGSGSQIGLAAPQQNFHAWSPNNSGILASTRDGGLRRDLSLRPDLLGSAFAAWSNYLGYMEDPNAPLPPAIVPSYLADPVRRRYRIRPPEMTAGISFSNAPILSMFFLQFNVRRTGGDSAAAAVKTIEVRARMVVQLWNPTTSSLIPEPLRLEVSNLPIVTLGDSNGGQQPIDLGALFGSPMVIELTPQDTISPGNPDDQSWLPGRVYYWRTNGGALGAWQTEFYNRTLNVPNSAVWVAPAGVSYAGPASDSVEMWIDGPQSQLSVALKQADGTLLSSTTGPSFRAFSTDRRPAGSNDEYRFAFPFRFLDPVDTAGVSSGNWLLDSGIDPRAENIGEPLIRTLSGGDMPSAYVGDAGNAKFTDENRLLDRVMGATGRSYNEDVPVFELPRAPILSLGMLQHLRLPGVKPFAIGNSWGSGAQIGGHPANSIFDDYMVSGIAAPVRNAFSSAAYGVPFGAPLPNPLLVVSPRKADGSATKLSDVLGASSALDLSDGYSAKHLLQQSAFNLNSTEPAAWLAVLRGTRFANGVTYAFLNASTSTGTSADASRTLSPSPPDAVFYRFSQSSQETFESDDPVDVLDASTNTTVRSTYAASNTATGTPPNVLSTANTHLYRRGMRALSPEETVAFANAIAARVRAKITDSGPFRTIEEFLRPWPLFADTTGRVRSALEAAIEDADINSTIAEFSSQWLTQADVMTALAPFLFARSDTFLVRAYGEAVNPVTGATEGRAWCEATVQRVPEYFDRTNSPETSPTDAAFTDLNKTNGRRFKVVSFRWLTRSDI